MKARPFAGLSIAALGVAMLWAGLNGCADSAASPQKERTEIQEPPRSTGSQEPLRPSEEEQRRLDALIRKHDAELEKRIPTIIEILKLKPGMTVVDIGAGEGRFTFPFADALKGAGRVYATEVLGNIVDILKRKAQDGGYRNVIPVLVQPRGDAFYQDKQFDVMFANGLLDYLRSIEDYFAELRPSLAPETGRLFLIEDIPFSLSFSESNIDSEDFRILLNLLKTETTDFPVIKNLDEKTRAYVFSYDGKEVPAQVRSRIIDVLNLLLSSPSLFAELSRYYFQQSSRRQSYDGSDKPLASRINPAEFMCVQMLVELLEDTDAFSKDAKQMTPPEIEFIRRLNKILLVSALKLKSLSFLESHGRLPIFRSKKMVVREIESAGYELVADHDGVIPEMYFLEFKRSSNR